MTFDDQETAIILAGLRMIQRMGVHDEEQDVATNGGEFDPLNDDEIHTLCGWTNSIEEPKAETSPTKVYVVMGNDNPDSVFSNEALADAYVANRKAEDNPSGDGMYRRIYWRAYEFELDRSKP